ncbi:MAG: hypothetical protein AB1762_06840 [Gemmatimonadota bacterium]
MPIPERYYREQIARAEQAERLAVHDRRRAWVRVLGEILLWTVLGLTGLGLGLHTLGVERALVYWWGGAFVWVAGVSTAVITAYLRGAKRGYWQ